MDDEITKEEKRKEDMERDCLSCAQMSEEHRGFHPMVIVHGQLFHLIGPAQHLRQLSHGFISIYFHDSDYTDQPRITFRYDKYLDISFLEDIKKMLHDVKPYFQTFNALREWVINDFYTMPYKMVIHAGKRLSREQKRIYNAP